MRLYEKKLNTLVASSFIAILALSTFSQSKAENKTFDGSYVGGSLNLGYSKMKTDSTQAEFSVSEKDSGQATSFNALLGTGSTFGTPVYYGIEGQLNLLNGKHSFSQELTNLKYKNVFGVSARIGLPFNCTFTGINFMPYVLAGFDYGRMTGSMQGAEEMTTFHKGLVSPKIGLGLDAAVTKNVFARIEYDHSFIKAKNTNSDYEFQNKYKGGVSTVKFGMYYKF